MAKLLVPPKSGVSRKRLKAPPEILAGKPLKGMSFAQKIYCLTTTIPKGKVTSYGSLAAAAGNPLAARAVGTAMSNCPYGPEVPCHRVIASSRALSGFGGEPGRKRKLLRAEGITFKGDKVDPKFMIELW